MKITVPVQTELQTTVWRWSTELPMIRSRTRTGFDSQVSSEGQRTRSHFVVDRTTPDGDDAQPLARGFRQRLSRGWILARHLTVRDEYPGIQTIAFAWKGWVRGMFTMFTISDKKSRTNICSTLIFQKHAIKNKEIFFTIVIGFLDPENILIPGYMRDILKQLCRGGGQKSREYPSGFVQRWWNTLGVRGVEVYQNTLIIPWLKEFCIININTTAIDCLWIVYFQTSCSLRAPPCCAISCFISRRVSVTGSHRRVSVAGCHGPPKPAFCRYRQENLVNNNLLPITES